MVSQASRDRISELAEANYRANNKASRATAFIEMVAERPCRLCEKIGNPLKVSENRWDRLHHDPWCLIRAARRFMVAPIDTLREMSDHNKKFTQQEVKDEIR